ncbi:MAG TPA: DNA double-strand break repair nuclease NurA [Verrucomicrobiae bacterium]|nr:DNA double-strand break repair nuclease NurA [Verrucomicrobiae bacterium]
MRLNAERFQRLQRSLDLALNQEWPKVGATTRRLATFAPTSIEPASVRDPRVAIATVATDGGENKLSLEPMRLQVVRVADSRGEIYFEEFIAESLEPDQIIRFFFQSDPRLQRFMRNLNLDWQQLLPRTDLQRGHLLSMLRELMEWAALIELAAQPGSKLLIRDGLLRSILLSQEVFNALRSRFEALTGEHGHLLVGVAKRSRVLSYLTVALGLTETFKSGRAEYLAIPAELEREAAPAQYRWVGDRAMGSLSIARLDVGDSPLIPIDVPQWQRARTDEIMALLHQCARGSFPIRGYPQPLIEAHEHARLGGIEIELLEALLLRRIHDRDPEAARVARHLRLLGQKFSESTSDSAHNES